MLEQVAKVEICMPRLARLASTLQQRPKKVEVICFSIFKEISYPEEGRILYTMSDRSMTEMLTENHPYKVLDFLHVLLQESIESFRQRLVHTPRYERYADRNKIVAREIIVMLKSQLRAINADRYNLREYITNVFIRINENDA